MNKNVAILLQLKDYICYYMHVTVVVKCELCYLFLFDSCWCIQSYCNPDDEVVG